MARSPLARSRLIRWLALVPALTFDVASAAVIVVARDEVQVLENGRCSLIEAIENAENDDRGHGDCVAGHGADVIRLAANADYVIATPLAPGSDTALPLITSTLTIEGYGSTIRRLDRPATPAFRFMVSYEADLTLRNLTFQSGRLATSYAFEGGAVLWQRGGNLSVSNVRFVDNGVSPNGRGGAIYLSTGAPGLPTTTVATFEDCVFENNFVDALSGQSGTGGGAIMIEAGMLEIDRCAFVGNRTGQAATPQAGSGGAINLSDHAASIHDPDAVAVNAIVGNTTFSGNRAGMAGAINLQSVQGFQLNLHLNLVTLVDNSAFGPVKGIGANAGNQTGQINVRYAASIVHGNGAGSNDKDCTATGGLGRVIFESGGGNLLHPGRGCTPDAFGDDFLDPDVWTHIEPIRVDHGHDLKVGSPLVDAIVFGLCGHGSSLDQRRRVRGGGAGSGGAHCDVGAVEFYGESDDVIFADGFD